MKERELERECDFWASRSSGPGGQNVNKVNSRVTVRWSWEKSRLLSAEEKQRFCQLFGSKITTEGNVLISSARFREQPRNRAACLEKLRAMIAAAEKPPKNRRPSRPSQAARERRLVEKKKISTRKEQRQRPEND